jgi:hypothetical protein
VYRNFSSTSSYHSSSIVPFEVTRSREDYSAQSNVIFNESLCMSNDFTRTCRVAIRSFLYNVWLAGQEDVASDV